MGKELLDILSAEPKLPKPHYWYMQKFDEWCETKEAAYIDQLARITGTVSLNYIESEDVHARALDVAQEQSCVLGLYVKPYNIHSGDRSLVPCVNDWVRVHRKAMTDHLKKVSHLKFDHIFMDMEIWGTPWDYTEEELRNRTRRVETAFHLVKDEFPDTPVSLYQYAAKLAAPHVGPVWSNLFLETDECCDWMRPDLYQAFNWVYQRDDLLGTLNWPGKEEMPVCPVITVYSGWTEPTDAESKWYIMPGRRDGWSFTNEYSAWNDFMVGYMLNNIGIFFREEHEDDRIPHVSFYAPPWYKLEWGGEYRDNWMYHFLFYARGARRSDYVQDIVKLKK
jgi:hypothetical protein